MVLLSEMKKPVGSRQRAAGSQTRVVLSMHLNRGCPWSVLSPTD
jgi:hypothetical protein